MLVEKTSESKFPFLTQEALKDSHLYHFKKNHYNHQYTISEYLKFLHVLSEFKI